LIYEGEPALAPQLADLKRLYFFITLHRSTTVLEFGCGYSTLVIKEALKDNREWFESLSERPEVRNSLMWEWVGVETNMEWANQFGAEHMRCEITTFNGRACHRYHNLPGICPDFIYLDGPDPQQIPGWELLTPMSADILYMEPILMPGTVILIDGRTNNARFIAKNLQRKWKITWDAEKDYTLMVLTEPPLGKVIANGADIKRWLNENSRMKKK